MVKNIADTIYDNTERTSSENMEIAIIRLTSRLSKTLTEKEYIAFEEEFSHAQSLIEKEWFYRGFLEGIRFIFECV